MTLPNWFFAFPLDGRFLLELPALPEGLRRYHPEDVHLTLAFLGGVGEAATQRALRALDELLARAAPRPIAVSLGEVVPMGGGREYSALSALLERGRAEAEACIGALRGPLFEHAGARPDTRTPKAHVTLARPTRRATRVERAAGIAWGRALDLRAIHGTLDRIALYTWNDDERHERRFRIVTERPLG